METVKVIRTNATHPDFVELVKLLDADLAERDGEETAFYAQYNGISKIKYALVAYLEGKPVSCGAIKHFDQQRMEIKRMYTREEARGLGIANKVLKELENWTQELGYSSCVLETGLRNPEAIALYEKNDFLLIPNFGQYIGVENSRCFEKIFRPKA